MAVMVVWLGGWCGWLVWLVCVEKAGVGMMVVVFILFLVLPFLVFPFFRFVGEQCGACAAAGAVRHRGTQGAGLRGATGGGSIGCDTWGGAHWVLMRVRWCVTHRAGHEQT